MLGRFMLLKELIVAVVALIDKNHPVLYSDGGKWHTNMCKYWYWY
jgi:hypothetical protein